MGLLHLLAKEQQVEEEEAVRAVMREMAGEFFQHVAGASGFRQMQ